jgi:hypothetical protein
VIEAFKAALMRAVEERSRGWGATSDLASSSACSPNSERR